MMTLLRSANRVSARLLALLMLCGLLMAPSAYARHESQSGPAQLAAGAACFIVTPVYGAFKLVYAGLGTVAGGLTWLFTGGDTYSAKKVWDASQKGTYIITPDHLNGTKPIEFVGPTRP